MSKFKRACAFCITLLMVLSFASMMPEAHAATAQKGTDDIVSPIPEDSFSTTLLRRTYTVSYDANGGKGTMEPSVAEYGTPVTVKQNEFTRDGYAFTGWNTQRDGSGKSFQPSDSYLPNGAGSVLDPTVLFSLSVPHENFYNIQYNAAKGGVTWTRYSGQPSDQYNSLITRGCCWSDSLSRVMDGTTTFQSVYDPSLYSTIDFSSGLTYLYELTLRDVPGEEGKSYYLGVVFAGPIDNAINYSAEVGFVPIAKYQYATTALEYYHDIIPLQKDTGYFIQAVKSNAALFSLSVPHENFYNIQYNAAKGGVTWTRYSGQPSDQYNSLITRGCCWSDSLSRVMDGTTMFQSVYDPSLYSTIDFSSGLTYLYELTLRDVPGEEGKSYYLGVVFSGPIDNAINYSAEVGFVPIAKYQYATTSLEYYHDIIPLQKDTGYFIQAIGAQNANATLYAQWAPQAAQRYTVTFDPQGGSLTNASSLAVTYGEKYGALPTPVRSGYAFRGWFLSPNGAGSAITADTQVTTASDHTLYAAWNPIDTNAKILVSSASGYAGKEVAVTISLENNPGIQSMKLSIDYDASRLELTAASIDSAFQHFSGSMVADNITSKPAILNWLTLDNVDYKDSGTFATLTFRVRDDAPEGDAYVTVTYNSDDVYNATGANIPFAVDNGVVTVRNYLPGDINGDGSVNNKDVTALFRYLTGVTDYVVKEALDVNGDGSVNNKDVTALFRYLSGAEIPIF